MADLSRFWDRQRAIASSEFDQASMISQEMLSQFSPDDDEKIRGIINHFATDDRVMMSLIGNLARAGLAAIAMGLPEYPVDDQQNGADRDTD